MPLQPLSGQGYRYNPGPYGRAYEPTRHLRDRPAWGTIGPPRERLEPFVRPASGALDELPLVLQDLRGEEGLGGDPVGVRVDVCRHVLFEPRKVFGAVLLLAATRRPGGVCLPLGEESLGALDEVGVPARVEHVLARDAVGADGADVRVVVDQDLEQPPVRGLRLERAVEDGVGCHVARAPARRADLEEVLGDVDAALEDGAEAGGEAEVVGRLGVALARLHQILSDGQVALSGGVVERGESFDVGAVELHILLSDDFDALHVVGQDRHVDGRVLLAVLHVGVGSGC
mmetsp:Transcript_47049/g.112099  ORF Transcript_47049/g.112099 Transcript_47049/m.112099 type:complete len:287 (-) Transcript_47049:454-1314(-)